MILTTDATNVLVYKNFEMKEKQTGAQQRQAICIALRDTNCLTASGWSPGSRVATLAGWPGFAPSHAVHSGVVQILLLEYRCGGSVGLMTDFPFHFTHDCAQKTSSNDFIIKGGAKAYKHLDATISRWFSCHDCF